MKRLIEIRTYQLKPGSGSRFHDLVSNRSVPLLREWGMDVVTFGQSVHDPDAYFLIRAYNDLEHLQSSQDAFYSTDAWRKGPRESIIELIQSDSNAVLWLSPQAIDSIRNSNGHIAQA
jgi:hypothetical protein